MPQLDVLTFSSQLFWFLICFFLLFFVINCLFLPKLDEIINTRNRGVSDSFSNSIHLLKFAESQVDKYNTALYQAQRQAKRIIDDALAQVEEMRANMKNIFEEENRKMSKLIEEEIVKFKAEHTDELRQIAISIALIYYTKLTNSKVKEELVASLISKEF